MLNLIEQIGARLKIARIASGYRTAKDFAEEHNISNSTYSQHETGKRQINIDTLVKYAELISVNPSWLVSGKGPVCPPCAENRDIEKNISSKIEKLEQNGTIPAVEAPLIYDDRISYVDIGLLKKIISQIIPILKESNSTIDNVKIVEFCFDVYNKLIITTVDDETKKVLIELCISSFFKGVSIDSKQDLTEKIARIL